MLSFVAPTFLQPLPSPFTQLTMQTPAPRPTFNPPLPTPCNPPIHHFSTVTHPSTAALHQAETSLAQLDSHLVYGRLGSPLLHLVQSTLSTTLNLPHTLLTTSKPACLTALLSSFLRPNSSIAIPQNLLPDSIPTLHSLFPTLSISILPYSTFSNLSTLCTQTTPPPSIILLQPPIPPTFSEVPTLSELSTLRTFLPPTTLFILDNFACTLPNTSLLSQTSPVDILLLSADRSGGLLDSDNSIFFGIIACKSDSHYRKLLINLRGKTGICSAAPSATDCERAMFAMRSANARREVQDRNLKHIVQGLQNHVKGIQKVWTHNASLDIGLEVDSVDAFLDALQIVAIGDGCGNGASRSFAWPCFVNDSNIEIKNRIVVSVGLENPDQVLTDLVRAAAVE